MQFSGFEQTHDSHPADLPPLPTYKELLDARQRRLEQRNKSAGALSMLGTLEKSASMPKLPQMNQKYQPPAMIRKLKYDFGSLGEFLSYDLKLKKPEDLFKKSNGEKKVEVKSKEEGLRKELMQHVRQEVDARDPKTILLEEKDPDKISKAAKKFVGDIVSDIFHDDLNILERKMVQKGVSRLYELLIDLDDDDPVRKIVEKYGYKTLADKFNILEAELDKKPQFINKKARNAGLPNKIVLQRMGSGPQNDLPSNSPEANGPKSAQKLLVPLLPMSQNQTQRARKDSKDVSAKRGDRPYVFVDQEVNAYISQRGNRVLSPKVKRKEVDSNERMSYAIRLIKDSDSLAYMYIEYEKNDKEQYMKELQHAEDNGKHNYKDFYNMKDNEQMMVMTKNHAVFTYSQLRPSFYMHLVLQFPTFSTLWLLNLRGCKLPENVVWLMLKMVEKYSPDIRMIDISENQVSARICDTVKEILIKCEVKTLKMAGMGLRSKGLAVVCLGLAENSSITDLDFNYNDIDEYGFKTLALILRHSRTLHTVKILRKKKRILSQFGEEKEVEEELGYHAMAALTKAFKHNKYLNPKNVWIFEPKAA